MIMRHPGPEPPKNNGHKESSSSVTRGQEKAKSHQEGKPKSQVADSFRKFAHRASEFVGSPWMFIGALLVIIGWAILGPVSGFSDTWQLVINTATTIVTFLMVFLIQNTQNRDAKAMHLKLDELIHSVKGARDKLIDLEDLSDEELTKIQEQFKRLRKANHDQRSERKK